MFRIVALLCAGAAFGAALFHGGISLQGQARATDPCTGSRDLRLTNGRFVTMDARGTTASELVIQNGRITSVGPSRGRLSPCTRTINLGGRTAVPGLIDNHNHIVLLGIRPGLSHAARRRGVDRRRAGGAHGARQGRARRRVHHVDGRVEPGAVRREAAADAGRARRRRCPTIRCSSSRRSPVRRPPTRAARRSSPRRASPSATPAPSPPTRRRWRRSTRCAPCRRSTTASAAPLDAMAYSAQRRRDDQRGHGRVQPAGHARSAGLVRGRHAGQRRPVAHVRRAGGAAPRGRHDDARCASSS